MTTNLYIDTEFNDFRGELISMAIVSERGDEFYEVLECKEPSPWVAEHVMPILEKDPVDMDLFQYRLQTFLGQFQRINLIADWPDDIKHFCQSLIVGPGLALNHPPITMEIRRDLSSAQSKVPHNALWDAIAIMVSDVEKDADYEQTEALSRISEGY
jgi:hypothetical protein